MGGSLFFIFRVLLDPRLREDKNNGHSTAFWFQIPKSSFPSRPTHQLLLPSPQAMGRVGERSLMFWIGRGRKAGECELPCYPSHLPSAAHSRAFLFLPQTPHWFCHPREGGDPIPNERFIGYSARAELFVEAVTQTPVGRGHSLSSNGSSVSVF